MAVFDCNFFSYCRGRDISVTVMIPTPTIPFEVENYSLPNLDAVYNIGPEDVETTIDPPLYWERSKPVSHRPKAKYPVLYLLHGGQGDRHSWLYQTQVLGFCEERKIALVTMDGEDAEWHRNRDMEFLSEELPDFVCGMFPVSERPEDTYLAGFSRGGGGAVHHALCYPERYGAFGIFASSVTMFEFEPVKMARKFFESEKKLPPAYLSTGSNDHGVYKLKYFRDLLREGGTEVTWVEEEQFQHGYRLCNVAVEKFLDWLPRSDFYADKRVRTFL